MAEALVVGEALVDEIVDSEGVRHSLGGSPANVALGLARLGLVTRLHTAIGHDEDGEFIRQHLAASGVIVTAESSTDAKTSRAVANLAADGSASYEFSVGWAPHDLDEFGAPTVIHVGSLATFLEPGCEVTKAIVRRGLASGALVTFDPNIRPSLIGDPQAALERYREFAFASNVTKLSEEDAQFLFPGEPLYRVLDMLIDGGVAVAAITRGSEDALLASAAHRLTVPPVETTVTDTVGAGDSFMATLIWSLVSDDDGWDGRPISQTRLAEIGEVAARAAALTVSRAGADLPVLRDLIVNEGAHGRQQ
jgi:fructokinase